MKRGQPMKRAIRPLGVAVILAIAACGTHTKAEIITTVRTTTSTVEGALNGLAAVFSEWDRQHQLDIVAAATSREDGEAKLAAYRAKRQSLEKLFAVGYAAVGAVAASVPLADAGAMPLPEMVVLVAQAAKAVRDVQQAIAAIQGDAS